MARKRYFESDGAGYSAYRPAYPASLITYLCSLMPQTLRVSGAEALNRYVLDCATGTGQLAVSLAAASQHVIATDISLAQLSAAPSHPNLHYCQASAEASPLASASVDLVTVAQALHWLDA